jgi:hypothetical protein
MASEDKIRVLPAVWDKRRSADTVYPALVVEELRSPAIPCRPGRLTGPKTGAAFGGPNECLQ